MTSFLRLAKDELPIKTDMIVMKRDRSSPRTCPSPGCIAWARTSAARSSVCRRSSKNANQAFVRGDLPKLVDADIVHRAVAKDGGARVVAVMRQLQGARRFVPLDHHFFERLGIPAEGREKIMEVLDTENAGVLRREQIVRRFVEIYERRRDLAKSLASTTSVLATLERIILSALYFLLVFIVLGIFDQNIVEMWFTASSMLLAFVFMFGNSIKQLFESVIFIFVIHPFDVGDNVLIEGERHAIRNIGILTTETVKWNGQVIYYPNASMSTKPLTNLTRMKKFTDEQTWVVDIATPAHVLEAMPLYFHKWAMDHAEDFHEITPRIYSHAHDPLKIKITLYYEYTFNGLPPSRAGNARDQLGLAMRKFLLDNNVVYRQQTLPVEIINGVNGRSSIVGGGGGGGEGRRRGRGEAGGTRPGAGRRAEAPRVARASPSRTRRACFWTWRRAAAAVHPRSRRRHGVRTQPARRGGERADGDAGRRPPLAAPAAERGEFEAVGYLSYDAHRFDARVMSERMNDVGTTKLGNDVGTKRTSLSRRREGTGTRFLPVPGCRLFVPVPVPVPVPRPSPSPCHYLGWSPGLAPNLRVVSGDWARYPHERASHVHRHLHPVQHALRAVRRGPHHQVELPGRPGLGLVEVIVDDVPNLPPVPVYPPVVPVERFVFTSG